MKKLIIYLASAAVLYRLLVWLVAGNLTPAGNTPRVMLVTTSMYVFDALLAWWAIGAVLEESPSRGVQVLLRFLVPLCAAGLFLFEWYRMLSHYKELAIHTASEALIIAAPAYVATWLALLISSYIDKRSR